jgi:hypothetical protein
MEERRGAYRALVEIPEGDHLEHPSVDGRILKWIFERLNEVIDWINVAHYRDRWRAVVNAVMNQRVP